MESVRVPEKKSSPILSQITGFSCQARVFFSPGPGTVRESFASLLTRRNEPSQGSGSWGLFIELSGFHGRRRGMCQKENASLIKAGSEM